MYPCWLLLTCSSYLQTANMLKKYCLTFLFICKCQSQQIVTVSGGDVRGTVLISHNDHPFWAFQGYLKTFKPSWCSNDGVKVSPMPRPLWVTSDGCPPCLTRAGLTPWMGLSPRWCVSRSELSYKPGKNIKIHCRDSLTLRTLTTVRKWPIFRWLEMKTV